MKINAQTLVHHTLRNERGIWHRAFHVAYNFCLNAYTYEIQLVYCSHIQAHSTVKNI